MGFRGRRPARGARRTRRSREALAAALAGAPDVVITTGGTGLSPTDRTPEATRAVLDREVPGLAEAIRGAGLAAGVPTAVLSRGPGRDRRRHPRRQPARARPAASGTGWRCSSRSCRTRSRRFGAATTDGRLARRCSWPARPRAASSCCSTRCAVGTGPSGSRCAAATGTGSGRGTRPRPSQRADLRLVPGAGAALPDRGAGRPDAAVRHPDRGPDRRADGALRHLLRLAAVRRGGLLGGRVGRRAGHRADRPGAGR